MHITIMSEKEKDLEWYKKLLDYALKEKEQAEKDIVKYTNKIKELENE